MPHPVTLAAVSVWCCVEPCAAARSSSGWADAMLGSPDAAGSRTADWGEEDIKCSPARCCMECWEVFLFIQLHVIPMSKACVHLPRPPLHPGLKDCLELLLGAVPCPGGLAAELVNILKNGSTYIHVTWCVLAAAADLWQNWLSWGLQKNFLVCWLLDEITATESGNYKKTSFKYSLSSLYGT